MDMDKPPGMEGMTEEEIKQFQRVARQMGRVEDGKFVMNPFAMYGLVTFLLALLAIGVLWLLGIGEFAPGE